MKKIILFYLIYLIFFSFNNKATSLEQGHFCGTDEILEQMLKEKPELIEEFDYQNEKAAHFKSFQKNDNLIIIPVVFHIIHDDGPENISRAQIVNALEIINNDMRAMNSDISNVHSQFQSLISDTEIEFRLATKDPGGNPTDGINRIKSPLTNLTFGQHSSLQNLINWNRYQYLNVWIVSNIVSGGAGTILGYAHFPSTFTNDGIVIRHDYLGQTGTAASSRGRTFTHEAGHYFGLYHTFQDGCHTPQNCNSSGDRVCDTPPSASAHFGCNTSLQSCNNLVNVHNHMDYTTCRYMFTKGQKDRMHFFIYNHSSRQSLHSNLNLNQTGAHMPNPGFEVEFSSFCIEDLIQFNDMSVNGNITSVVWEFPGGTPSVSTEKNPKIQFHETGYHDVIMIVTNEKGSTQYTFSNGLYIPENFIQAVPFTETFDNTNVINENWNISSPENNVSWKIKNNVASIGNNSIYINSIALENSDANTAFTFDLPILDISSFEKPVLAFDYAYVNRSDFSDSRLRLFVSSNCGQSFLIHKTEPLTLIQTVNEAQTDYFTPEENQWDNYKTDLNNYKGLKNMVIRFQFTGGNTPGNNLYIDNIKVYDEAVSSVFNGNDYKNNFSLYPNPFNDQIEISVISTKNSKAYLVISDLMGREISNHYIDLIKGNNQIKFDRNSLKIDKPGIYILTLTKGDIFISDRISFINH